jgi:hypothetical protein
MLLGSDHSCSAHQKELWAAGLKKHGSAEAARKWVAPPGKSPHHTGRAIDFFLGPHNSSRNIAALRAAPAYYWLVCNAIKFGFTPYAAEPWHWEYNPPDFVARGTPPPATAPAAGTSAGPAPAGKPAWVGRLVPLLNRYRGNIPLSFLLGWIDKESGGRIGELTSLNERGYFQLHPEESKSLGVDHQRLSSDPDYSVQAGIKLVQHRAARARSLGFPEGTELFWRVTKLLHWLPGGVKVILEEMRKSGVPPTNWEAIKQYVSGNRDRLIGLFRTRLHGSWDPMRGIANVDAVFERGRRLAAGL